MTLALAGITTIQALWISKAIKEQEKEFEVRVNSALNDVNDQIHDQEKSHYLDLHYGNIDSLVESIMIFGDTTNAIFIPEFDTSGTLLIDQQFGAGTMQLRIHDDERHISFTDSGAVIKIGDDTIIREFLGGDIEDQINEFKPQKNVHEILASKRHYKTGPNVEDELLQVELQVIEEDAELIESTVKHKTFRRFFRNRDVNDRIRFDDLNQFITEAFEEKGLGNEFTFGVYNDELEEYEDSLVSPSFGESEPEFVFEKPLFPYDDGAKKIDLVMHLDNQGSFVWTGVKPMLALSVLFTLLILFCFGYSLYFIFKQKKLGQMKDDFVNNMTHELKTPLATISLAADSIRHPEVINDHEEVLHFITMIKNEEGRMNTQIENVLRIASLDKGELGLNRSHVDLKTIIETSIGHLQLTLKEMGATINFNSEVDEALVYGDPFHLENMINNVLDNSVKYRRDETLLIRVGLQRQAGHFVLTIADNGIGMNKKSLNLAFDKFYREESGNIHTVKGFGLGLSYVKKIVDQHKGEISLSNGAKSGLIVQIKLPEIG